MIFLQIENVLQENFPELYFDHVILLHLSKL